MSKLKITYVKSMIGYPERQRATLRTLGLRKLHHSVVREDSPVVRGQIGKVSHLVKVEVVDEAEQGASK